MNDVVKETVNALVNAGKEIAEEAANALGDAIDYVIDAGTSYDGQNDHDTEEYSEISQKDRDNLKKYVFTSPTYFEYPLKVGETDSKNPEQLHSVRFSILARENSRVASATNSSIRDNTNAAIAFYGGIGQAGDENDLQVVDKTEQNNLSADQARAIALLSSGVAGAALGFSMVGKNSNLIGKGFGLLAGGAIAAGGGAKVIETVRTVRTRAN